MGNAKINEEKPASTGEVETKVPAGGDELGDIRQQLKPPSKPPILMTEGEASEALEQERAKLGHLYEQAAALQLEIDKSEERIQALCKQSLKLRPSWQGIEGIQIAEGGVATTEDPFALATYLMKDWNALSRRVIKVDMDAFNKVFQPFLSGDNRFSLAGAPMKVERTQQIVLLRDEIREFAKEPKHPLAEKK